MLHNRQKVVFQLIICSFLNLPQRMALKRMPPGAYFQSWVELPPLSQLNHLPHGGLNSLIKKTYYQPDK